MEEQRSEAGCIARRMQRDFRHGLLELVAVQLQGANCGRAAATDGSEEEDPPYLLRNVLRSLNSMMMNSAASSRFSAAWTLPSPHPSEPASTVSFPPLPSGTVKFIV